MINKVKTIPFREKVAANPISFIFAILFFLHLQTFPGLTMAQSDSSQNSILDTKVSLSLQNISIQEALDTLSSYPNIKFSYINYDLPLQDKISIQTKGQTLRQLLDSIFKPYGISYYVVSRQIVLKKEKKNLGLKTKLFTPSGHRKISVSLYNAVGSSYRRLRSNNPVLVNQRNTDEKSIRNYAAGCYITYQYLPSIAFRSGLSLFNSGEKGTLSITDINLDSIGPGNNGNGNGSGNGNGNGNNVDSIFSLTSQSYPYKNKYNYLNIPLMVGYTLEKEKVHFSAFAGISLGFFLSYTTTFPMGINNYENSTPRQIISPAYQKDPRTHDYRKVALTIPIMVEAEYLFNKDMGIFGALGLNYFTSSIYQPREHVKHRPYYVNVSIGLTYHLPKVEK